MVAFPGARGRPVTEAFVQGPGRIRSVKPRTLRRKWGALHCGFWKSGTKKNAFLQNEPEKLLILKRNCQKTNRNEAKNEAEK